MNAYTQYEEPLILLFSGFTIEALFQLLSNDENIILRQRKQIMDRNESSSAEDNFLCNVQFEGLEFNILWSSQAEGISGCKQVFCNVGAGSFQSKVYISLGSHIKSGHKNTVIMMCLFRFARYLIEITHPISVLWKNSNIISDTQYFIDAIDIYEKGGAFPILSTVDFIHDKGGVITSHGLEYFSDQEISYNSNDLSQEEIMKRVMRIAHDIAVNGAYSKNMQMAGLSDGETIFISLGNDKSIAQARSCFD